MATAGAAETQFHSRKVGAVTTVDALLAVYDRQMRGVEPRPPAEVTYERDGPLLRAVGGHRGYICGPRDMGVTGAELDRLIARQRDYFAGRVEAVDDSAPILRRLGLRAVTTSTAYVWPPPQPARPG
jgi:hypothetical protein